MINVSFTTKEISWNQKFPEPLEEGDLIRHNGVMYWVDSCYWDTGSELIGVPWQMIRLEEREP